jgi:hypothetical protein
VIFELFVGCSRRLLLADSKYCFNVNESAIDWVGPFFCHLSQRQRCGQGTARTAELKGTLINTTPSGY